MKKLRYTGDDKTWARLGKLSKGQIVEVTFIDSLELREHDDFEALATRTRPHEQVDLAGAPSYDIRKIKWDHPKLPGMLLATSLATMTLIATACAEIGCDIVVTDRDTVEDIANKVLELAHANGWNELDENARHVLPILSEPVVREEPDEDEDEDEDSGSDDSGSGDSDDDSDEGLGQDEGGSDDPQENQSDGGDESGGNHPPGDEPVGSSPSSDQPTVSGAIEAATTKQQLEEIGRLFHVELDKRKNMNTLRAELVSAIGNDAAWPEPVE